MPRKSVLPVLLLGCASTSLFAQAGSPSLPNTSSGSSSIVTSITGFVGEQGLQSEPFTLVQQTTTLRTLADGTHITTVREETRIRDAEGRLRTEITSDGHNPVALHLVQIFDPVAHTWTTLNEQAKEAHVNHMPEPKPPTPEQQARLAELRARAQSAAAAQPNQPTPTQTSQPPQRHTEVLSPRTIAGVMAEGKRITRTIPAGKEGNDRDLTIVTETWTSPELHVALERTTDDPRTGKVTMITTSLERASPDPALFQIPANYKIIDQQPNAIQ